MIVFDFFG